MELIDETVFKTTVIATWMARVSMAAYYRLGTDDNEPTAHRNNYLLAKISADRAWSVIESAHDIELARKKTDTLLSCANKGYMKTCPSVNQLDELEEDGIVTFEDLSKMSEIELGARRNIGKKSIEALKKELGRRGLRLGGNKKNASQEEALALADELVEAIRSSTTDLSEIEDLSDLSNQYLQVRKPVATGAG